MPLVAPAQLVLDAQAGKAISFPTDTVPALGTLPPYASTIFSLKGRSLEKPLILMAARAEDLWAYVRGSAAERKIWQEIAARFWPGALTLVLPSSGAAALNPLHPDSLGMRVPAHPQAREILAATGALATTSANLSGQDPLTEPTAIAQAFPTVSVYSGPGWDSYSGLPSTVARWTPQGWEILRQGQIVLPL